MDWSLRHWPIPKWPPTLYIRALLNGKNNTAVHYVGHSRACFYLPCIYFVLSLQKKTEHFPKQIQHGLNITLIKFISGVTSKTKMEDGSDPSWLEGRVHHGQISSLLQNCMSKSVSLKTSGISNSHFYDLFYC